MRSTHVPANRRGSSPDLTRSQRLLWHLDERHLYALSPQATQSPSIRRGQLMTPSGEPLRCRFERHATADELAMERTESSRALFNPTKNRRKPSDVPRQAISFGQTFLLRKASDPDPSSGRHVLGRCCPEGILDTQTGAPTITQAEHVLVWMERHKMVVSERESGCWRP